MPNAETLITENLETWSTAIKKKSSAGRGGGKKQELYGIAKLRELILELAVRGLLVQQDSNDEPASKLLERAATEKALLIKDGKLRKKKSPSEIKESDKPFQLPTGWAWTRISEAGHDWGQKKPESIFTYIDVGSINKEQGIVSDPAQLSAEEAPSRARKIVKEGTVIYSTVRPYLLNIAVVSEDFVPEPIASTAFAIIHPFQGILASFIYRYLRSPTFVKYVESCQTGIAYPAINDKQFFSGILPVPPLAEQHRIVAKVDELMALCDQLEEQQEDSMRAHQTLVQTLLGALTAASERGQLEEAWQRIESNFDTLFTTESSIDELKQTILQLAVMGKLVEQNPKDDPASNLFEKIKTERKEKLNALPAIADVDVPFTIPEGWIWQRMGQVYLSSYYGPRFGKEEYVDKGVPTIRTTDMTADGEIALKNPPHVRVPNEQKLEQYRVKTNDLLITRSGTIGMMAIFRGDYLAIPSAYLIRLRFPTCISVDFFFHLLRSPYGVDLLGLSIRSVGVPNVNATSMSKFVVPLPPLAEQHRIVAKVDELMALCDALKANLKAAQTTQLTLADTLTSQISNDSKHPEN